MQLYVTTTIFAPKMINALLENVLEPRSPVLHSMNATKLEFAILQLVLAQPHTQSKENLVMTEAYAHRMTLATLDLAKEHKSLALLLINATKSELAIQLPEIALNQTLLMEKSVMTLMLAHKMILAKLDFA
jgi:hypothetical protein